MDFSNFSSSKLWCIPSHIHCLLDSWNMTETAQFRKDRQWLTLVGIQGERDNCLLYITSHDSQSRIPFLALKTPHNLWPWNKKSIDPSLMKTTVWKTTVERKIDYKRTQRLCIRSKQQTSASFLNLICFSQCQTCSLYSLLCISSIISKFQIFSQLRVSHTNTFFVPHLVY